MNYNNYQYYKKNGCPNNAINVLGFGPITLPEVAKNPDEIIMRPKKAAWRLRFANTLLRKTIVLLLGLRRSIRKQTICKS